MRLIEKDFDLTVLENELVPVYTTDVGEKVVYGTELHSALNVKSDFSTWIKRRLAECDAEENIDYATCSPNLGNEQRGGQNKIEYIIKLDTAKEMAMLERNEKGKQVRRYFIRIEKKYKENSFKNTDGINSALFAVKFIADDMRVNEASRILMYENMCKDFNIPTGFLPKYERNGNRELKAASHLLKDNGCAISTAKFNEHMISHGYMEIKERQSSKGGTKSYKALTESGIKYGENAVSPHNQREVQPLYYSDTFMELYNKVI